jgi:hypothetical protein
VSQDVVSLQDISCITLSYLEISTIEAISARRTHKASCAQFSFSDNLSLLNE